MCIFSSVCVCVCVNLFLARVLCGKKGYKRRTCKPHLLFLLLFNMGGFIYFCQYLSKSDHELKERTLAFLGFNGDYLHVCVCVECILMSLYLYLCVWGFWGYFSVGSPLETVLCYLMKL